MLAGWNRQKNKLNTIGSVHRLEYLVHRQYLCNDISIKTALNNMLQIVFQKCHCYLHWWKAKSLLTYMLIYASWLVAFLMHEGKIYRQFWTSHSAAVFYIHLS